MPETRHPLSPLASGHANDFGGAECVEAVDEGNADLDFGGLAVGVSCGDAFTEGLEPTLFVQIGGNCCVRLKAP